MTITMRLTLALLGFTSVALAAEPPRARPPEFTDEDRAAFFDDAFATLVGERPKPAALKSPTETPRASSDAAVAWADLVEPDVLETEIKRQAAALAKTIRTASAYKAGAYKEAVDSLGVVATVFAVIAEHTGQPRWRDDAAGLRDLFAEGAAEADGATDASFAVAAARAADLGDLTRGTRPDAPQPKTEVDWSTLGSRETLMRRMKAAEEDRLRGWMASERDFRRSAADARHEAQVLALLAEAILRPEAYDHDDPDYQAHARGLRDATVRLSQAIDAGDQPAAATAMSEVSRSCVDCHADYRG
jgi:hypothetical protein